jgi:hypothetical protein
LWINGEISNLHGEQEKFFGQYEPGSFYDVD